MELYINIDKGVECQDKHQRESRLLSSAVPIGTSPFAGFSGT